MISARTHSDVRRVHVLLPALLRLAVTVLILAAPAAVCRAQYLLGPFVQVSGTDPFANSTADHPTSQNGHPIANSTVEPWVVVNPLNPLNIVATYQQDRWSPTDGGSRGLMEAWSNDGGLTWNPVVVPGIGLTSNGTFERDSDPWNAFAPNGDLYHVTLAFNDTTSGNAVLVNKSTDGGQTWSSPITVAYDTTSGFNDKESITADPFDYHYVYTVWDINNIPQFSRTADAGATWSTPLQQATSPNTIDHQVVVSPSGVLYDFYNDYSNGDSAAFVLSTDHGATWSSAFTAQQFQDRNIYDPAGNQAIRDSAGLFPIAVDRNNGNLYIAWMDSRFSSGAIDEIAFSGSTDGGMTWSTPIKINQTPTNLPTGSRQALIPSLAVAEDGTICVCYYDFRNTPSGSTQILTDRFAIFCHPSSSTPFSSASSWGNELRVTNSSFDFHLAAYSNQGLMVGDYMATQAVGDDFIDVFGTTSVTYPSIIASRKLYANALQSVSLNPATVAGGNTTTGTVTLAHAAGTNGVTVALASSNPSAAQPAVSSVTVPSGASTATFTVNTSNVTSSTTVSIQGTYNVTQSAGLTVLPLLQSISVNPTSVIGGNPSTATVTLNGPVPGNGVTLTLGSDNSAATVPATLALSGGATSGQFTVNTTSVTSSTTANISAAYGGVTVSTGLGINPPTAPVIASLSVNPTSVIGGASSTGTVTLTGNAPMGGVTVTLSSGNGAATVPQNVTVQSGSNTATFTITTSAVDTDTPAAITGTTGTTSQSATLTVKAATIASLSVNPASVTGGASSTGTVTLNGNAGPSGTVVSLGSNSSAASVNATVTVPAGSNTTTFPITTKPVVSDTGALITGTTGAASQSTTLTVKAPVLTLLTLNPSTVVGGTSSTGTVKLTGAAATAITIKLSAGNNVATVPASVTIPAGSSSVSFTVKTRKIFTTQKTVVITATGTGTSVSATLTVTRH